MTKFKTKILKSTHTCSFEKIIEYLKTPIESKDKDGDGTVNVKLTPNKITRTIYKKLQINEIEALFLGFRYCTFVYDIKYDDKTIICVTKNPHLMKKIFKYTDNIIIEKNIDGTITLTREIKSKQKNIISSLISYSVEEKYILMSNEEFMYIFNQCK